jgi:hypothetical protein
MFRALREDGAIQVVWGIPVRSWGDGFVQVGKWFQLGFITREPGPVMLVTLKIRRLDQLLLLLVLRGARTSGDAPRAILQERICANIGASNLARQ